MPHLIKRIPPSTLLVSAVVFALIGFQASAIRPAAQPEGPTTVATVDIQTVWDNLDRTEVVRAELDALNQELEAAQQEKREEIDRLEQELSLYTPDTQAYQNAQRAYLMAGHQYNVFTTMEQRRLEITSGDRVRELFQEIRQAAAELAAREGYDLMLMDDTVSPIDGQTQEEVNRQISAQRILHTSPQLDVTQQLINFMNQQ